MKALPPRACKENLNLQEDKSTPRRAAGFATADADARVIPCSGRSVWQQIQNLAHVNDNINEIYYGKFLSRLFKWHVMMEKSTNSVSLSHK
jgi:hypothetical protein